jgi:hypothetical protein
MEISKSFSAMHSIFGDLMPIVAELFVLQLNGKDEEVSKLLGEVVTSKKLELAQIEQLVQILQAANNPDLGVERNKHKKIEQIFKAKPDLMKHSDRAASKILGVGRATIQRVRLKMKEEEVDKTPSEQKKDLCDEQLDRAVEIVEAKIEFKPYGTGMVRVEGIPDNGIHRGPIIINVHVTSRKHNIGPKPSSKYDVTPILNCIFHNKDVHGIKNRSRLQEFSGSITELKIFSSDVRRGMARKKITERILKIAYILNGECVMGLPTK